MWHHKRVPQGDSHSVPPVGEGTELNITNEQKWRKLLHVWVHTTLTWDRMMQPISSFHTRWNILLHLWGEEMLIFLFIYPDWLNYTLQTKHGQPLSKINCEASAGHLPSILHLFPPVNCIFQKKQSYKNTYFIDAWTCCLARKIYHHSNNQ